MKPVVAAALLLLCIPPTQADDASAREIEYLLHYVQQSGCAFERNGTTHDAADAADHLRLKYSRGKRYADTAEQFIDRLASGSSWTGKPYTISCDGESGPAGPWLHRALADFRAAPAATDH